MFVHGKLIIVIFAQMFVHGIAKKKKISPRVFYNGCR